MYKYGCLGSSRSFQSVGVEPFFVVEFISDYKLFFEISSVIYELLVEERRGSAQRAESCI